MNVFITIWIALFKIMAVSQHFGSVGLQAHARNIYACTRFSGGHMPETHRKNGSCRIAILLNKPIWVLFIVCSAVESAATERAMLSANSNDSVAATSTQTSIINWVQITVVPLGGFLVGASIWGIFKSTVAWETSLSVCGRRAPEADNEVPVDNGLSSNGRNAQDLEEGLEVLHRRMDYSLTTTPNSRLGARDKMQPEFDVPSDGEI